MTLLIALALTVALLAGYVAAAIVLDLYEQHQMNTIRREVGIPTKPYKPLRRNQ